MTRRRKWTRIALIAIFWLIALALLFWSLRTVSLRDALDRLRLTPLQIALFAVANLGAIAAFNLRWWIIVRALGYRIGFIRLLSYRLAAFSVTYFTPGPQFGGEPVQVVLLKRDTGMNTSAATMSVLLDRIIELTINFAFLIFGVVVTLRGPAFGSSNRAQPLIILTVLTTLLVGFLILTATGRHPLTWMIERLAFRRNDLPVLRRMATFISETEHQTTAFLRGHTHSIVPLILASLLGWAALIGEFWLATWYIDLRLTPLQVVAMLTAARIAILLPAPGGLGTLEAGQVWTTRALGLSTAAGLSLSLLIHLRDIALASLGFGIAGLYLRRRATASEEQRLHDV